MNVFQADYNYRIREWKSLRIEIRGMSLDKVCVAVDDWWQRAPLINHHLHWADSESWPDPWTMLSDNTYCTLTRAMGICYTLMLSDITEVNLVAANDTQAEEHYLVIVGHAKYVLNYYPKSVLNTSINDFTILRQMNLDTLKNNIK
jgi:hypothetical protein